MLVRVGNKIINLEQMVTADLLTVKGKKVPRKKLVLIFGPLGKRVVFWDKQAEGIWAELAERELAESLANENSQEAP